MIAYSGRLCLDVGCHSCCRRKVTLKICVIACHVGPGRRELIFYSMLRLMSMVDPWVEHWCFLFHR